MTKPMPGRPEWRNFMEQILSYSKKRALSSMYNPIPGFIQDPSPVTPDDIRELQVYKPPLESNDFYKTMNQIYAYSRKGPLTGLITGAEFGSVSKQYKKAKEQAMLDHQITMHSAYRRPDLIILDDFETETQRRPKMEPINIRPVLNGWVVKIACTEVVFTDKRLMLKEIGRYIAGPDAVEKEYLKNDKNPNRESTR